MKLSGQKLMNTDDQKILNFYRCWNWAALVVVVPAAYWIGAIQNEGPTLASSIAISIGGLLVSAVLAFAVNAAFGRWMPKDG